MWKKTLIIVLLFFVFTLLQNSFLATFNILNIIPNLVFILFFIFIFFSKNNISLINFNDIFLSIFAGFLLDIFLYAHLGPSIVSFFIIGILLKKIISSLNNKKDDYPYAYFIFLFLVFFIIYKTIIMFYLHFFDLFYPLININFIFLIEIFFNIIFASIGFWFYKKFINYENL